MKIDSIVVLCWKGDFRLARICLASVRFFYPDIPLFLMKDTGKGDFDTSELEKALNVSSAGLSGVFGPGVGKFELFFRPDLGRFLFIDADQIMAGPVLDALEKFDEQFIVEPDPLEENSPVIDRVYYDRKRLQAMDPDYRLPAYHFNSGQFVGTAGVFSREDFEEHVTWGNPIKIRDPKTFKLHEQGLLNYLLHKKSRAGRITMKPFNFMHLARTDYFWSVPLESIKRKQSQPLLFHWAGTNRSFVSLMRRSDLLKFFEQYYYAHVNHGPLRRFWRSLKTTPQNAYLYGYQLAGSCKRKTFSWPKKHPIKNGAC